MKALLLLLALTLGEVFGERAEFDKTVHDFGTISLKDGPQSCTFNVKNVGSDSLTIYTVVSSCGCTDVEWTRETLAPGQSGFIKATYSNDEGTFPFDKTVTVYLSDMRKPVILHLRGEVTNKISK